MLNKKFLTRLLNKDFRHRVMASNSKLLSSNALKLKQYATYIVDKHNKERNIELKDSVEYRYGFCPIDVIAYCSIDGSVKKIVLEFNSINHFLAKGDHESAVEVAICILMQLANEVKKDIESFDIDKIDADMKKAEQAYAKKQEKKEEQEDTTGT